MYNVGFGDCFLLTFEYRRPRKDQHILIDFGSVGGSRNATPRTLWDFFEKKKGKKLSTMRSTASGV
jgi:hypothetical protein